MSREWWIHMDGGVEFADGETDHAMIVVNLLFMEWASAMGIDPDLEAADPEIDMNEPLASLRNLAEEEGIASCDMVGIIQGVDPTKDDARVEEEKRILLDGINGTVDPRDYAYRRWGWKAYRNGDIESWFLRREDLEAIADGISGIYFEDGMDEVPEDEVFTLYPLGGEGRMRYEVTFKEIESGDITGAVDPDVKQATKVALNTIDDIDRDTVPSFYKGSLSDSVIRFDALIT
jgi:hypothetical protein